MSGSAPAAGVTVTMSVTLRPEQLEGFAERMQAVIDETATRPGFRSIRVVVRRDDPTRVLLIQEWDRGADYQAYRSWRAERGKRACPRCHPPPARCLADAHRQRLTHSRPRCRLDAIGAAAERRARMEAHLPIGQRKPAFSEVAFAKYTLDRPRHTPEGASWCPRRPVPSRLQGKQSPIRVRTPVAALAPACRTGVTFCPTAEPLIFARTNRDHQLRQMDG